MHQRCVADASGGEGGERRVVADIAKLSVGREEYYTRELATDHEAYLSGHGESPGRWYGAGATSLGLQGEASPAGFQAMFEGRDPTTGSCLDARMAATPSRPPMWSCGRPRACQSCKASVMRSPPERCCLPITRGWPRRSPTWTSTWGPAAATAVSSTCPDKECWGSGSTTEPPGRVTRSCIPTWSSPTASRDRTAAGPVRMGANGQYVVLAGLVATAVGCEIVGDRLGPTTPTTRLRFGNDL